MKIKENLDYINSLELWSKEKLLDFFEDFSEDIKELRANFHEMENLPSFQMRGEVISTIKNGVGERSVGEIPLHYFFIDGDGSITSAPLPIWEVEKRGIKVIYRYPPMEDDEDEDDEI